MLKGLIRKPHAPFSQNFSGSLFFKSRDVLSHICFGIMPAVLRDNAINKILQLEKEKQQYPLVQTIIITAGYWNI